MDVQKVFGGALGEAMTNGTLGAWADKPKVHDLIQDEWDISC